MVKHIVLYNFDAYTEKEISVRKGELVHLQKTVCKDWSKVRLSKSNRSGLVPTKYIAEEGSLRVEDYFFEISRREAENLLFNNKYGKGAFILRQSEQLPDKYALSIKDKDRSARAKFGVFSYVIKHFIIQYDNKKKTYCINSHEHFSSVNELVDHYKKEYVRRGRRLKLLVPCSKEKPLIFREWEIKRNSIKILEEIGSGNFGVVHKGLMNGKTEVAIKQLKHDSMSTDDFLREANTMKLIRHDKLVALFGVCTDREPILIIQEFMPNGSLENYLRKTREPKLKKDDHIHFAIQIASGMEYLENKELVHRDLAARNVLVGLNNICKICDFGLTRALREGIYVPTEKGNMPVKWMAPESIEKEEFSIKSDVWSYGIVLMEIFTNGVTPYPGYSNFEVIDKVVHGNFRMKNPKKYKIPEHIYEKISDCWKTNPDERPTFAFLYDFFQNYDQKIYAKYEAFNVTRNSCSCW